MLTFKNYGPGDKVWSIELNTIQTQQVGAIVSSATTNDFDNTVMDGGGVGIIWQYDTTIADSTLVNVISNTVTVSDGLGSTTTAVISWMDRIVLGGYIRLFANVNNRVGAANDYEFDFAGNNYDLFPGYLGLGAKGAGNNPVTAGNPPVRAEGTSWALLPTTGLWIYVDPADDAIKLYNDTGATINAPLIVLFLSAPTGKRT